MNNSIHSRILVSAFITLLLFMGLTGLVLDEAFQNNVKQAQRDNLRTQVYSLLAAAELDDNNQLQLPAEVTEPRLNLAESSLVARVLDSKGKTIWSSLSAQTVSLPEVLQPETGKFRFSSFSHARQHYTLVNFATSWVTDSDEAAFTFQVAQNNRVLDEQIILFRQNLWGWLAGVSLVLLLGQFLILRWGLKPLRQVASDLLEIEQNKKQRLKGRYPKEIEPLTNNLNALLDSAEQQLARYRDALGNMAHSLKTPIAVLQGILNKAEGQINSSEKTTALEQIKTINAIVEYQLQRAATVGKAQLKEACRIKPVAEKISNTLNKVYQDKQVKLDIDMHDDIRMAIDEGDLYELLGNLLENAYKWCQQQVRIKAIKENNKTGIIIEDDGPGISDAMQEKILKRGQRADETTPGHGLGLAMVNDMLLLYQGSMQVSRSPLGGAMITITL